MFLYALSITFMRQAEWNISHARAKLAQAVQKALGFSLSREVERLTSWQYQQQQKSEAK